MQYKPHLKDAVRDKLATLDLSKYKDCMRLLIMGDIDDVMRLIEE